MLCENDYLRKVTKTAELLAADEVLKEIKRLKKLKEQGKEISKSIEELNNTSEELKGLMNKIWKDYIFPIPDIKEKRLDSYLKNNRETYIEDFPRTYELARSYYWNHYIGPFNPELEKELKKQCLEEFALIMEEY